VPDEEPHLIGRGLHDLGGVSIANVTGIRSAIATVTDSANTAWSREVDGSLD
jgi:hypothetical protein